MLVFILQWANHFAYNAGKSSHTVSCIAFIKLYLFGQSYIINFKGIQITPHRKMGPWFRCMLYQWCRVFFSTPYSWNKKGNIIYFCQIKLSIGNCKFVRFFWQECGIKVRFVSDFMWENFNWSRIRKIQLQNPSKCDKNIATHIVGILLNLSYRKTGHWASGTKFYNNSIFITYVGNMDLETNILYYVSMVCPNMKLEIILILLLISGP